MVTKYVINDIKKKFMVTKYVMNPDLQNLSLSVGSLDSNWVVGATLEKKLLPLPLSLALCAFLNHRKNQFQCGFGITVG